jgi:hypothetical protein
MWQVVSGHTLALQTDRHTDRQDKPCILNVAVNSKLVAGYPILYQFRYYEYLLMIPVLEEIVATVKMTVMSRISKHRYHAQFSPVCPMG